MGTGNDHSGGQGNRQDPKKCPEIKASGGVGVMATTCLSGAGAHRLTWKVSLGAIETDLGAAILPAVSPGLGTALL